MIPSHFSLQFRRARACTLAAFLWLSCGLAISFAGFTVVIDPGHGGAAIPGKSDSTQEGDGASWNNAHSATKKLLETIRTELAG